MRLDVRLRQAVLALVALGSIAGCAQLDLKQPIRWFPLAKDEPQTPTKVLAVWTEALLQHPDRAPTRGFGGRLMFFGPDSEAALRVDGSLVVYGYEEEGRDPKDTKPDRKYVFTREQLAEHYGKSKLGHSYSVWIPWDKAGGPTKQIALICRFEPVDGPAVLSEQTDLVLPGESTPVAAEDGERAKQVKRAGSQTTRVRPVAYHAAIPGDHAEGQTEGTQKGKMKTATIPISPYFGRLTPVARTRPRAVPSLANAQATQRVAKRPEKASEPDQTATTSPAPPESRPAGPRSTDCPPAGSPAPTAPSARPAYGHGPWPRRLEGSRCRSQSSPRRASGFSPSSTSPVVRPTSSPFGPVE